MNKPKKKIGVTTSYAMEKLLEGLLDPAEVIVWGIDGTVLSRGELTSLGNKVALTLERIDYIHKMEVFDSAGELLFERTDCDDLNQQLREVVEGTTVTINWEVVFACS